MARRNPLSQRVRWAIVAGVFAFLFPFFYFDRMDLALPSLLAAAAIGCAIATFWKHKSQRWFWSAIAVTVVVHICLIARLPLRNLGAFSLIFGFYALVDYCLVVVLIKLLEAILSSPEEHQGS